VRGKVGGDPDPPHRDPHWDPHRDPHRDPHWDPHRDPHRDPVLTHTLKCIVLFYPEPWKLLNYPHMDMKYSVILLVGVIQSIQKLM